MNVTLKVYPIPHLPGEWFAELKVGEQVSNAPGASAGNAALNAWSQFTASQEVLAAVAADARERGWTGSLPSRLTA